MKVQDGFYIWSKGSSGKFDLPLVQDPILLKQRESYFSPEEFQCKCKQSSCKDQKLSCKLLDSLIKLREAYDAPMVVTSGIRCVHDHKRIYAAKGITDESKIPMGSQHLKGQAVDISDKDGKLKAWINDNVAILEQLGLYCEDFAYTSTWVHFSNIEPKSKKRFFIP